MLRPLMEILFPTRCLGCGRGGSWACSSCLQPLLFHPPWCPRCGYPGPPPGHARCLPAPLSGLRSAGPMEGLLRQAVTRLKFHGQRALALPLGQALAPLLAEVPGPVDGLVPVPLHPQRQRERGFNQADLLAGALARVSGLQRVACLERRSGSPPQVGRRLEERRANVEGAFGARHSLVGLRLVLVDDVCTSGATLAACARALREAGAGGVWALTVAREL